MKVLVLYFSATGNTEKVTESLVAGLKRGGMDDLTVKKLSEAQDIDYYDYDLICLGFPSINWCVPAPMQKYLKANFAKDQKAGRVVPGAPKNGRKLLLYCTYCGAHTGLHEAVPAAKYAGQFFEHIGFTVVDEWYILCEYVGNEPNNTLGRMGDIRGLPDEASLNRVESRAFNLANCLK